MFPGLVIWNETKYAKNANTSTVKELAVFMATMQLLANYLCAQQNGGTL